MGAPFVTWPALRLLLQSGQPVGRGFRPWTCIYMVRVVGLLDLTCEARVGTGMKYTKWYFFLAALLVASAAAQTDYRVPGNSFVASTAPDSSSSDDTFLTIRKRVDEVNVLFIATDRHGKFVRNLNEQDFSILDDHKPPQSVVSFKRETDLPLRLGLLVDTSGSVRTRFSFEQEAAVSFLQQT